MTLRGTRRPEQGTERQKKIKKRQIERDPHRQPDTNHDSGKTRNLPSPAPGSLSLSLSSSPSPKNPQRNKVTAVGVDWVVSLLARLSCSRLLSTYHLFLVLLSSPPLVDYPQQTPVSNAVSETQSVPRVRRQGKARARARAFYGLHVSTLSQAGERACGRAGATYGARRLAYMVALLRYLAAISTITLDIRGGGLVLFLFRDGGRRRGLFCSHLPALAID